MLFEHSVKYCVHTLPTFVQSCQTSLNVFVIADKLILTGHRRSKVKLSDANKENHRVTAKFILEECSRKQHNSVTGVLILLTDENVVP